MGLDSTRERILADTPEQEWRRIGVWNADDFAVDREFNARAIPGFSETEERVRRTLEARLDMGRTEFVSRMLTVALAQDPVVSPRTDDFVVFLFDEDFGPELRHNLELGASPGALARLAGKGLLPDQDDEHIDEPRFPEQPWPGPG